MTRTKSNASVVELLEPARPRKTAKTKRDLAGKRAKKSKRAARSEADAVLDRVLAKVEERPKPEPKAAERPVARAPEKAPAPVAAPVPSLRMARVVTAAGRAAEIVFRAERRPVVAAVADEVESEVVATAARNRDSVLVEHAPGEVPVIVGVVQTRTPRDVVLKGRTVRIEAESEVFLGSGGGAMRIRSDGDVELVGSRIAALSSGLFRIVGRMLRMN